MSLNGAEPSSLRSTACSQARRSSSVLQRARSSSPRSISTIQQSCRRRPSSAALHCLRNGGRQVLEPSAVNCGRIEQILDTLDGIPGAVREIIEPLLPPFVRRERRLAQRDVAIRLYIKLGRGRAIAEACARDSEPLSRDRLAPRTGTTDGRRRQASAAASRARPQPRQDHRAGPHQGNSRRRGWKKPPAGMPEEMPQGVSGFTQTRHVGRSLSSAV